ncbi:hypothetical protein G6L00_09565 [Agrobacterium rhizogenes]|nr:hypothetical protein [Rhizobium rhizogenes]NTH38174.1 hypothetical protein [Rhizobium rhizogenes]NTJ00604.1 hypothetical protein [Rhizobium rhizogenes]
MNGYFRDLVGNFTALTRFVPSDTRLEKLLRLIISGAVILLGLYSLNQGYEVAYGDVDHALLRSDGNADHYFFDMMGALAWIMCILGNRLRIWSWAFAIFLAWWCYTATGYYLANRYYVMGQDGCLPCGERAAELHLGSGAFGVAAILISAIFIKQTSAWRFIVGAAVAFIWFFLLAEFT